MTNHKEIKEIKEVPQQSLPQGTVDMSKLPKEAQEKLNEIKGKLDKLQKKILDKFDKYIIGIGLLPPQRDKEGKEINKEKINVVVLVDDADSQKMSKQELKDK